MYRSTPGIVAFLLIMLITSGLLSQEAVLSSGGDASGTGGTVAYSIGQVAYIHFNNEEGQISLGVQQPHVVIIVGTDDPLSTISISLYPNPVQSTGFLEISGSSITTDLGASSFELYDISGRLLLQKDITELITDVPMEQFENAIYFLKVICQDAEIKTFKVIKTN